MTDPYDRPEQMFPRLGRDQIDALLPRGEIRAGSAGELLFDLGSNDHPFMVVLSGRIEIVQPRLDGSEERIRIHQPGEFTGELDMFSDQRSLVRGRMLEAGEVLAIPRDAFREAVASDANLSELVMRAFILRRVGLLEHDQGDVVVLGTSHSADTLSLRQFLGRNGHPYRYLDVERDELAQRILTQLRMGLDAIPIVIVRGHVLRKPSKREVADMLGISGELGDAVRDVVVIGAGPAGLAAAVYGASEGLDVVVLESEAPGGQAGTSSKIENYLGFPTGISGQALTGRALTQAQKFGARMLTPRKAVALHCDQRPYRIELDDGESVRAKTVVLATGARYRRLAVERLRELEGRGVYYGATNLEARLCSGSEVTIIGGGNSAGQAAVYLSPQVRHVHMLVRGAGLVETMSSYLIARIQSSDRITLHPYTEVVDVIGNDGPEPILEAQVWRDGGGTTTTHPIPHLFVMIGADPNTDWLRGCVALDDKGFVLTGDRACEREREWPLSRRPSFLETSLPGVFAVGDVRSASVKRVASAVGEGSMCIRFVHDSLAEAPAT